MPGGGAGGMHCLYAGVAITEYVWPGAIEVKMEREIP
jgi:hypothetical protein